MSPGPGPLIFQLRRINRRRHPGESGTTQTAAADLVEACPDSFARLGSHRAFPTRGRDDRL